MLFTEQGLTGITGFHRAGIGFLLYDLAAAINDWCNDGEGVLDPDRALATRRAYHGERQLTREEVWFFPAFMLYASAASWLQSLASAPDGLDQDAAAAHPRFRNPMDLANVVMQNHAHFLYVDPRRL